MLGFPLESSFQPRQRRSHAGAGAKSGRGGAPLPADARVQGPLEGFLAALLLILLPAAQYAAAHARALLRAEHAWSLLLLASAPLLFLTCLEVRPWPTLTAFTA